VQIVSYFDVYYVIHIKIEKKMNSLIGSTAHASIFWKRVAWTSVVDRGATTVLLTKLLHGSHLYRIDDGLIINSQSRRITRRWL